MFPRNSRNRRTRSALWAGVFALSTALLLGGCYDSTTLPEGAAGAAVLDDLSLADIQAKVSLSPEQAEALGSILDTWRQQRGERNRDLIGLRMLADASEVLDRNQMLGVLDVLDEKRQVRREKLRAERKQARADKHEDGVSKRKQRGERMLEGLDLSDEQRDALEEARREQRASRRAAKEELGANASKEQRHARMQALHEERRATLEAILTPEQQAQLAAAHNARALQRLEKALERVQDSGDEKRALLSRILDLDDQQVAAAEALHQQGVAELQNLVTSLRAGQLDATAAREASWKLHAGSRDAYRELLTSEQQQIFDRIKHHGRGGRAGKLHGKWQHK